MKKKYNKPTMEVVELSNNSQLMCTSGSCNGSPYECGTTCTCGCNDTNKEKENSFVEDEIDWDL